MNPKINSVLADIRQHLVESIVPVQSITNPNAVAEDVDALDTFMAESAAFVARETGLSEDEALDIVFQVAESGEQEGALPPLPAADASLEEIEEWLTAASETGFAEQAVMSLIEDEQEEAIRIGVPDQSGVSKQKARDDQAAYVKKLRKSNDRGNMWVKGAVYSTAGAKKKGQQAYDKAMSAWDKVRGAKQEQLEALIGKMAEAIRIPVHGADGRPSSDPKRRAAVAKDVKDFRKDTSLGKRVGEPRGAFAFGATGLKGAK